MREHSAVSHNNQFVLSEQSLSFQGTVKAYIDLTKPRITLLIAISTAVGYSYGAGLTFRWMLFVNAVIGTVLMASGSAALNQWFERDSDSRMKRTHRRPVPSGIVAPHYALLFGLLLSVVGFAELIGLVNTMAAALGLLTSLGYVCVYTPLKRVGPICTTVGAFPGAMPPLIGFAAASGHLNSEAWILFAILFLWQFPHFHAIAWLYREDYSRAGIRMLAVVSPNGKALALEVLITLVLLIPTTLAPTLLGMTGRVYFTAALVMGIAFLCFGLQMARKRDRQTARRLLLASVIYMPALFAFLVFDSPRFTV